MNRRILQLQKLIEEYTDEIKFIRDKCKHVKFTTEEIYHTDGWCKIDDIHYNEFTCLNCGKIWKEDIKRQL